MFRRIGQRELGQNEAASRAGGLDEPREVLHRVQGVEIGHRTPGVHVLKLQLVECPESPQWEGGLVSTRARGWGAVAVGDGARVRAVLRPVLRREKGVRTLGVRVPRGQGVELQHGQRPGGVNRARADIARNDLGRQSSPRGEAMSPRCARDR